MICNFKGHLLDISDDLLKEFEEEMHNISQEMLDTCAHLALLKYDDITDDDMFKKRIEDVMFVEMTKHRIERTTIEVVPGQTYDIEGHKVTVSQKMCDAFQDAMQYPLDLDRLSLYVMIVLNDHEGENLNDKTISEYIEKFCLWEMSRYIWVDEDVMFVETTKHQIKRTTEEVVPNQTYDIKGHKVTVSQKMCDEYLKKMQFPLDLDQIALYMSIVFDEHNETISDKELSKYIEEECLYEMSQYTLLDK